MPLWANPNQPAIALANQKIQGQSIRVDENRFAAIHRRVLKATLKPSSCQIGLRCVRPLFVAQSRLRWLQQSGLCSTAPAATKEVKVQHPARQSLIACSSSKSEKTECDLLTIFCQHRCVLFYNWVIRLDEEEQLSP